MRAIIHKPSTILAEYIDYFLFLENESGQGFYKTFPNTNICLAFYKSNSVQWDKTRNFCDITESDQTGVNKLFAFHRRPFSVAYSGKVEQVCILFKMETISFFTHTPIHEIDKEDDPVRQLFGKDARSFIEQLFSHPTKREQIEVLESYLVKKFTMPLQKEQEYIRALEELKRNCPEEKNIVNFLSGGLNVNPSTLYRRFLSLFGQSPQDIYKTIRFRRTLYDLLSKKQALTKTAYDNNFFDQSHFIKDIRQFTGESPGRLLKNIADVQGTLLWVKN